MNGHWFRSRLSLLLMAVLVVATVTACADQDNERRFANEPLPTVDLASLAPTASPSAPSPVVTRRAAPALVSPVALLGARGAPKVFYFQAGRDLLAFRASGSGGDGEPEVLLTGEEGTIVSFDASPNGDRVAVLLRKDGHLSIVTLDATGKELMRHEHLDQLVAQTHATPTTDAAAGRDLVDWSPQGDRLLVALARGGIITIPLKGDPVVTLSPEQAPGPIDAAWSPAGDAIAYVNRASATTSAGLYLVSTAGPEAKPRALVEPTAQGQRSVRRLAWQPSGRSILYTRSNSVNGLAVGGDLFQISPSGGGATIVASAGRVAPISAIVDFLPSPDGRAVAYTIVVPGPQGPRFHSLWIQQLGTSNRTELSATAGSAINELWWASSGLIWRSTSDPTEIVSDQPNEPFTLVVAGRDGAVTTLYRYLPSAGTPTASPVASPVASPGAAPRIAASPGAGDATPVASPRASATPAPATPESSRRAG